MESLSSALCLLLLISIAAVESTYVGDLPALCKEGYRQQLKQNTTKACGEGNQFCAVQCKEGECRYLGLDREGSPTLIHFACDCKSTEVAEDGQCADKDECELSIDNCDTNANCTNTDPKYYCECNAGYKDISSTNPGVQCEEIDQCRNAELHNCNLTRSACSNIIGGVPGYQCDCDTGYKHADPSDSITCADVNECTSEDPDYPRAECPDNSRCVDSVGSFSCVCDSGYRKSSGGFTCEDIVECDAGILNTCNTSRSACNNTIGDFRCDCISGYEHSNNTDYKTCTDINECGANKTHDCDTYKNRKCQNTDGTFECICKDGYNRNDTSDTCENIDECTVDRPCGPHASCADTDGSFTCTCDQGYRHPEGNLTDCADIDECNDNVTAHECNTETSYCVDIDGDYKCICYKGYERLNKTDCKEVNVTIADIDKTLTDWRDKHEPAWIYNRYVHKVSVLTLKLEKAERLCHKNKHKEKTRKRREVIGASSHAILQIQAHVALLELAIDQLIKDPACKLTRGDIDVKPRKVE